MINTLFPIKDRVYFLKNNSTKQYEEYRYKEHGSWYELKKTNKFIPYIQAKSYKEDTNLVQQFTRRFLLPHEKDVWNHAPDDLRQALILSYVYHEHHGNNKVANVETTSWKAIPFFHDLLGKGKQQTHIQYILPHFRTWFNAMTMTNGNHKLNLRLGHIHLTEDTLGGNHYSCVHWDIGASRFSLSLLLHWIVDDMSS